MFEDIADEIFQEAGVSPELNRGLWYQTIEILSVKMATLSVTMGFTTERVKLFNEQKESLIEDLKKIKIEGGINENKEIQTIK